jgi:hypothetical protein
MPRVQGGPAQRCAGPTRQYEGRHLGNVVEKLRVVLLHAALVGQTPYHQTSRSPFISSLPLVPDAKAGDTIARDMLELDLKLTADQALAECRRRGLVIISQRELAGCPGSSHWHLRFPGHPGTLELNELDGRVWVKVHPLREGSWAKDLARELAANQTTAA